MSGITVSRFWSEEEIKVGTKQNTSPASCLREGRWLQREGPRVRVEEKGDMEVKQSGPEEVCLDRL